MCEQQLFKFKPQHLSLLWCLPFQAYTVNVLGVVTVDKIICYYICSLCYNI